jgi:hypothetical protein
MMEVRPANPAKTRHATNHCFEGDCSINHPGLNKGGTPMKRMLAFVTILALVATLSLPTALAQQATAIGLPNPIFESTAEEAAEASGAFGANLFFDDSTDIRYSYIKGQEGPVVFQVMFTWEEAECTIRVFRSTQMKDLSGMHYPWSQDHKVLVSVYPGRVMYNEGEAGVLMWYDVRNKLVYNISMTGDVTLYKLMKLAWINAEAEQDLIGLPNPIVESTAEEAAKVSGTPGANVPEGAEDVRYFYIKGQEEPVIFQVKFIWEGAECTIRVFKGTQVEDLSGMYYPWEQDQEVMIGVHPGHVMYNKDVQGVAMWYDARNELVYNVSMGGNATLENLMKLALVNAE